MLIKSDDPDRLEKEALSLYQVVWGKGDIGNRLEDIEREHLELQAYKDDENMKEETGDLLGSLFALCAERGWNAHTLVKENLAKVRKRYNEGYYDESKA